MLGPNGLRLRAMDRVEVAISVDSARVHPKLVLELLDRESGQPLLEVAARANAEARANAAAAA